MRQLVLIRHSAPEIIADRPARAWSLSAEGRRRCELLAERLRGYALGAMYSSQEPKALETANLVAGLLGLRASTAPGLHEHERSQTGWRGATAFQAAIGAFFTRPDDLVLGDETAAQARARFAYAVERVVAARPAGNLGIVAHGSVITLLVAAANQLDPLAFWRRLGLPAYVVLELPGYRLHEVVEHVE